MARASSHQAQLGQNMLHSKPGTFVPEGRKSFRGSFSFHEVSMYFGASCFSLGSPPLLHLMGFLDVAMWTLSLLQSDKWPASLKEREQAGHFIFSLSSSPPRELCTRKATGFLCLLVSRAGTRHCPIKAYTMQSQVTVNPRRPIGSFYRQPQI